MEKSTNTPYRWVILFLMVFANALLSFSNFIFASRAVDVLKIYNMNQAQLVSLTSISMLPGAFLGILLGMLLDKKGVKKVTAICFALGALCMIWRVVATNYVQLLIITLLVGVFFLLNVIGPKYLGAWFPREEMGIAMGVFSAAASLGTALAFALGNVFPSTRVAFIYLAAGFVLLFLLWVILAKDAKVPEVASNAGSSQSVNGGLKTILKSRSTWLVVIISGLAISVSILVNTYLTQAFQTARGLSAIDAGLITTLLNVSFIIGSIVSGWVVTKTGRINITYTLICVCGGVLYLLIWFLPFSNLTYVLVALAGLISIGSIGVNMTRIPLLPLTGDFGPESVATAAGLVNTGIGVLAFAVPVIVADIAGSNFDLVFIIIAGILIVIGLLGLLIPELGQSGKLANAAKSKGNA